MLQHSDTGDDDVDSAKMPGSDTFHPVSHQGIRIEPLHKTPKGADPAVELIRQKIQGLYEDEPNAKQEIREVKRDEKPLSKHQKFMYELSTSGKGLAEIQTAWHNYYIKLSDEDKHQVWREFYENNGKNSQYNRYVAAQPQKPKAEQPVRPIQRHPEVRQAVNPNAAYVNTYAVEPKRRRDRRTAADIKRQIVGHVSAEGQLTIKHHLQSLFFGLGVGAIVVVITLFSFFNQLIITPFIQPSRKASATPLIVGADSVAPSSTPEVIIPKINVEIPLVFNIGTTDENQIENGLEDGVVHYPTTVLPGQRGNTAFFGHSSNNIFNPGHYKFAFALLHDLVPGDTFYLTYQGKVYAYQVYQKEIVEPSDVGVLNNVPGKTATATLITCDPPGTSLHRLVVWGEQVSPDPNGNQAGTNTSSTAASSAQLPDNGPSLWNRLTSWL